MNNNNQLKTTLRPDVQIGHFNIIEEGVTFGKNIKIGNCILHIMQDRTFLGVKG